MNIHTLGIDIAKSVFQLHGIDEDGVPVLTKKLRRGEFLKFLSRLQPCLVGIEACATSHYWARELTTLGHDVRLIPPSYVKPYVKRQKNDAADAEAICEAVSRPNMSFTPIKTPEQQSVLVLHRGRDLLMRQRTMLLNAIRAHLAEFGISLPQGPKQITAYVERIQQGEIIDDELPVLATNGLIAMGNQLESLEHEVAVIETHLKQWHKNSVDSQRLESIPGIGLITATALAASVCDPAQFKSSRHFAAWIGLVPRQNSSGGKERLGRITKMGNRYLRRLLVIGATSVIRHSSKHDHHTSRWIAKLKETKPHRLVTVAIANKTARIVWALMSKDEHYKVTA
ncbi:MAG: IS110 family transposase [Alphaproteobacteria bacterium]